jgi:hypothetical protein
MMVFARCAGTRSPLTARFTYPPPNKSRKAPTRPLGRRPSIPQANGDRKTSSCDPVRRCTRTPQHQGLDGTCRLVVSVPPGPAWSHETLGVGGACGAHRRPSFTKLQYCSHMKPWLCGQTDRNRADPYEGGRGKMHMTNTVDEVLSGVDLREKICVITGATSGWV